jgi:[acyl-carrier-protein] S-malonyltransferase
VLAMTEAGVTDFIEVGSGKVLAGLVKRIATGVTPISVGTADDIASYKTRNG